MRLLLLREPMEWNELAHHWGGTLAQVLQLEVDAPITSDLMHESVACLLALHHRVTHTSRSDIDDVLPPPHIRNWLNSPTLDRLNALSSCFCLPERLARIGALTLLQARAPHDPSIASHWVLTAACTHHHREIAEWHISTYGPPDAARSEIFTLTCRAGHLDLVEYLWPFFQRRVHSVTL